MSNHTSTYEINHVTVGEFGDVSTRGIAGAYESRGAAFAAAVDAGQEIAGPERPDYRRPVVSVVADDILGMCVKIGSGDVDAEYHILHIVEN